MYSLFKAVFLGLILWVIYVFVPLIFAVVTDSFLGMNISKKHLEILAVSYYLLVSLFIFSYLVYKMYTNRPSYLAKKTEEMRQELSAQSRKNYENLIKSRKS